MSLWVVIVIDLAVIGVAAWWVSRSIREERADRVKIRKDWLDRP